MTLSGQSPPNLDDAFDLEQLRADDARPAASIVIACYDQGRFLADAIRSALAQTSPAHAVIVVDDGSTDDTAQIAAAFPTVIYLHQTNGGLASARNLGLSAVTAPFVCFLDADDRLAPHALEAGIAAADANPACAFVAGSYRLTDASFSDGDVQPVPRSVAASYAGLLRSNSIAMCATVLFRREPLVAIGGFDQRFAAAEDYDVYLRLAHRLPFAFYDEIVADYRQHDANMTKDATRMLIATTAVLERQRGNVTGDASLERALSAGLSGYRSAFGRAALRQAMARIVRRGEWMAAGRDVVLTARLAPRAFGSLVVASVTGTWKRGVKALAAAGRAQEPA